MNIQEVREIARNRGIAPGRRSKIELIRIIQRAEGNFDCFARAYSGYCDQWRCLWREDCLSLSLRLAQPQNPESGGSTRASRSRRGRQSSRKRTR